MEASNQDENANRLEGRRVFLRPILGGDYEALQLNELSDKLGIRWRLRGRTPPPEAYGESLWGGVQAQFLVMSKKTRLPVGLVCLYGVDFSDGFGFIAMAVLDEERRIGLLEGVLLFVDYVFTAWPLRKLYGEVLEFNYSTFSSGDQNLFVEEGRLRQHAYYNGTYWDKIFVAMYRDKWDEIAPDLLRYVRGTGASSIGPVAVPPQ